MRSGSESGLGGVAGKMSSGCPSRTADRFRFLGILMGLVIDLKGSSLSRQDCGTEASATELACVFSSAAVEVAAVLSIV